MHDINIKTYEYCNVQLGYPDKDRAIKRAVVCANLDISAFRRFGRFIETSKKNVKNQIH